MIASVAVKHKVNSDIVFDYSIQENQKPQLYSLVQVEFSGKKTLGIILKFKQHSYKKCKSIKKIISKGPLVTKEQIQLAKDISDYFISPFGPTLLSFIPNLPQKEFEKIEPGYEPVYKGTKRLESDLILAHCEQRIHYFIQKTKSKKQNLIVLPSIRQIETAIKKIKKINPALQLFSWHSKISHSQKRIIWQKCLKGENVTIVSSRDGLFLPFRALDSIFIDTPNSFSYFEDQLPRYNALFVARLLQKQFNSSLIIGESFPSITTYIAYMKKILKLKKLPRKNNFEIYDSFYDELKNPTIINKLTSSLEKAKKIAVVWPFKEQRKLICRDCNTEISCHSCGNEYYQADFTCTKCKQKAHITCPKCHSLNLKLVGYSKHNILESFNKIDKNKFSFYNLEEINDSEPIIDQTLIPFFDSMADFPFISYKEKIASALWLASEKTSGKIHIFTEKHKKTVMQITNLDWDSFIRKQLIERKKEGLPPYSKAIKVVIKYSPQKSQVLIKKIYDCLEANDQILIETSQNKNVYLLLVEHQKYKKNQKKLKSELGAKIYFIVDPVDFSL